MQELVLNIFPEAVVKVLNYLTPAGGKTNMIEHIPSVEIGFQLYLQRVLDSFDQRLEQVVCASYVLFEHVIFGHLFQSFLFEITRGTL